MRIIENENYRIEYFDEVICVAEQQVVRIVDKRTIAPYQWVELGGSLLGSVLARYLFADGVVEIDLTDYLRLHAADLGKSVRLTLDNGDAVTLSWTGVGLYDVSKIVRKPSIFTSIEALSPRDVTPPGTMFVSMDSTANIIAATGGYGHIWLRANYKSASLGLSMIDANKFDIPSRHNGELLLSVDIVNLQDSNDYASIAIREALCGHEYALVRWIFPTGAVVQHLIEVRDVTDTTSESYALRTIDGSFDTRKGAGQSFKLHLDNLTAYDAWYYGTIATSSRVEVSFDNGATWQRVDVTTKKLTQPNGDNGKRDKLDIDVTYSKHSAL